MPENNHFNHFKVHTQYSICEGALKIVDLAEHCAFNNISADGHTSFSKAVNKAVFIATGMI